MNLSERENQVQFYQFSFALNPNCLSCLVHEVGEDRDHEVVQRVAQHRVTTVEECRT